MRPSKALPRFPDGEYELAGEIGSGGMAVVYRARDVRRGQDVAIKVLRPDVAQLIGPERFLREIAVTSAFSHPNILPLLDSGKIVDDRGRARLYYVMPLIKGDSLRARMRRERMLPLSDALDLTIEILEALSYAHARGVIHRDIKPENVLLSGGRALVTDFGLARALPGAKSEDAVNITLTLSGLIIGTPEYMSPEQSVGDAAVDARSDLFSVGCVLYEMLVGEMPFTAERAHEMVIRKSDGSFVRASALRTGVPQAIDDIFTAALAPKPAGRYASCAEFLGALSRVRSATPYL